MSISQENYFKLLRAEPSERDAMLSRITTAILSRLYHATQEVPKVKDIDGELMVVLSPLHFHELHKMVLWEGLTAGADHWQSIIDNLNQQLAQEKTILRDNAQALSQLQQHVGLSGDFNKPLN